MKQLHILLTQVVNNHPGSLPAVTSFCIMGLLLSFNSFCQPAIEWQNSIGGNEADFFYLHQQTEDGGYILGGYSNSGVSGDKTDASFGQHDYWIVKVDPSGQTIEWQKTIGGSGNDLLAFIQQTDDKGYIVAGQSNSGISGNKTGVNIGGDDYWVLKLDSLGSILWQTNIGGTGEDYLRGGDLTSDGGCILAGRSNSNITGDKTEDSKGGFDYWVVKLDVNGDIQWDNTIGGLNDDLLFIVQQTNDGGYILDGFSSSDSSEDKSEDSQGGNDYWIVKLDASGSIQWDNTIGGDAEDATSTIQQTNDNGYIVGGSSNSNTSGDKTEDSEGDYDYWIVKLDASGNFQWDNTIGASATDVLSWNEQTDDSGYILAGYSNSLADGDKTEGSLGGYDYWVVKLTSSGDDIEWQNTIGGDNDDFLYYIQQTNEGGFLLGGRSSSGISGDKTEISLGNIDYWIVKLTCYGPPASSIAANGATTVCKPLTVTLAASPASNGLSYKWKKDGDDISGATNSTYEATASGKYKCKITNDCGSATSSFIEVTINSKPKATIEPSGTIEMCAGDITVLTGNGGNNLSYQWKEGNTNISGETNQTYNATEAGNYKVKVTKTSTGCSKTSKATTVNITCKGDGTQSTYHESRFAVFPNPGNGRFFIELSSYKIRDASAKIQLTSLTGHLLFEENMQMVDGKLQGEIFLSSAFSNGIYFLQMTVSDEVYTEKVVLQK